MFFELAALSKQFAIPSLLHQAFLGSAITALALLKSKAVGEVSQNFVDSLKDLRSEFSDASDASVNVSAGVVSKPGLQAELLYEAYLLAKYVAKQNEFSAMALMYALKMLHQSQSWAPEDNSSFTTNLAKEAYTEINNIRSDEHLDLRANYAYSKALCLTWFPLSEKKENEGIKHLLKEAERAAATLINFAPNSYIYSEEKETMVKAHQFKSEAVEKMRGF